MTQKRRAVVPIKKSNTGAPIFFYIAIGLLFLLVITLNLVSGIYARYASSSPAGEGARVAKFSIESDLMGFQHNDSLRIKPGETHTSVIEVKNNSEVAVEYIFEVVNQTGNLPLQISITSSDGDQFIAIGATETITVSVSWGNSDADISPEYAGKADLLRWNFTVTQRD